MKCRILVAGIGNIFLGDDGFGVEVARRLHEREWPEGVEVVDFGIRGMDLVYALLEDYEAVIFVDITQRGQEPGTLYLLEPQIDADWKVTADAHGMDPVKVLSVARELGAKQRPTYLVGVEPEFIVDGEDSTDVVVKLSQPVGAAIDGAVEMVERLTEDLLSGVGVVRERPLRSEKKVQQKPRLQMVE